MPSSLALASLRWLLILVAICQVGGAVWATPTDTLLANTPALQGSSAPTFVFVQEQQRAYTPPLEPTYWIQARPLPVLDTFTVLIWPSSHWGRLVIRNQGKVNLEQVVRFNAWELSQFSIWEARIGKAPTEITAHHAALPQTNGTVAVPVQLLPGETLTVYVHARFRSATVQVMPTEQYLRQYLLYDFNSDIFMLLFTTTGLLLAFISLIFYLVNPDRAHLYYFLFVTGYVFYQFFNANFKTEILAPFFQFDYLHLLELMVAGAYLALLYFIRAYIPADKRFKGFGYWFRAAQWLVLTHAALNLVLLLVGEPTGVFDQTYSTVMLLAIKVLGVVAGVYAIRHHYKPAAYFLASFALYLTVSSITLIVFHFLTLSLNPEVESLLAKANRGSFLISATLFIVSIGLRLRDTQREKDAIDKEKLLLAQENAQLNEEYSAQLEEQVQVLKNTKDQLLLSEKLATLGQLVAGIIHEINTPLGAAKSAIAVTSQSRITVLNSLQAALKQLTHNEIELLRQMVLATGSAALESSTREQRALRRNLQEELEQKGIPHADMHATSLVEIGYTGDVDLLQRVAATQNFNALIGLVVPFGRVSVGLQILDVTLSKIIRIVETLKRYAYASNAEAIERVNLQDNLNTILILYSYQIRKQAQLVVEFEANPVVLANSDKLGQVWTNLIQNALQAMPEGGELRVTIRERVAQGQVWAEVSIQDTGSGISPEVMARLFQPFVTTKPKGVGTGLGLNICKEIVESAGGSISVTSQPGQTAFAIMLPAA